MKHGVINREPRVRWGHLWLCTPKQSASSSGSPLLISDLGQIALLL